jgi:hypothetical protein
MPNGFQYPFAQSESSGRQKTAVSTVVKSRQSANISICKVLSTTQMMGAQNTACIFVLFYLDNDSYIKNVRALRGNAGTGFGSGMSLSTWDSGSDTVNDNPHGEHLTIFTQVENAFVSPATENANPSSQLTNAHDFEIKLRKGWCAVSVDTAYSPSEDLGFGCCQNMSQLGDMSNGLSMVQKLLHYNLPFVLPTSVSFPLNNSLASLVTPYLEWNEVTA